MPRETARDRLARLDPLNLASCIQMGEVCKQVYISPTGVGDGNLALAGYPNIDWFHNQGINGLTPAWVAWGDRRNTYVSLSGLTTRAQGLDAYNRSNPQQIFLPACKVLPPALTYANQVLQYLRTENRLSVQNVAIFGHSMGGAAGQLLAMILKNIDIADANIVVNAAGAPFAGDARVNENSVNITSYRWENLGDFITQLPFRPEDLEANTDLTLFGGVLAVYLTYTNYDQYVPIGTGYVFLANLLSDIDHQYNIYNGNDYLSLYINGIDETTYLRHALRTYLAAWELMLPVVLQTWQERLNQPAYRDKLDPPTQQGRQWIDEAADIIRGGNIVNTTEYIERWPAPLLTIDPPRFEPIPGAPPEDIPPTPVGLPGGFQPSRRYANVDKRYIVRVVNVSARNYICKWVGRTVCYGPGRNACRHFATRMNQALNLMHSLRYVNSRPMENSLADFFEVATAFQPPVRVH